MHLYGSRAAGFPFHGVDLARLDEHPCDPGLVGQGPVGAEVPSWDRGILPLMKPGSPYITLDSKGRATLPDDVRKALGVGAGDLVLLERTDRGTFELVPASLVPRDQLWFHHPEVRERLTEAEDDFAAGRSTRTETPEEAQAFLDALKESTRAPDAG